MRRAGPKKPLTPEATDAARRTSSALAFSSPEGMEPSTPGFLVMTSSTSASLSSFSCSTWKQLAILLERSTARPSS
eukprot:scaffold117418_cov65-Phaeocystis_antarctica.AAC.5